jgi:hypothetical protein
LFGMMFVAISIRPHPNSEAGRLTGDSRSAVRLMRIATGAWLFATAGALFVHNLNALLDIFVVFSVLYTAVTVLCALDALVAGLNGSRGPSLPQDPLTRQHA